MTMRVVPKAEWIAALRDKTRYRKARARLARRLSKDGKPAQMCCLGVYADLAGMTWAFDKYEDGYRTALGQIGSLASDEFHGHPVLDIQQKLITLNDKGAGWDAVIEHIEREL